MARRLARAAAVAARRVLNVGGGPGRVVPDYFSGWRQDLLDIDPAVKPDICLDALAMTTLPAGTYDAVYCSHTLEHFYRHEVETVLKGFLHVLREDGLAHVAVPNVGAMIRLIAQGKKELDDIWYASPAGPISYHDVLYGHGGYMAMGNLYYAHKCGFTEASLTKEIFKAGFASTAVLADDFNLTVFAFKSEPTEEQLQGLGP